MKTTLDFSNESNIDFSDPDNIENLNKAIAVISKKRNTICPIIINGKRIFEGELETIRNPASINEVMGRVHLADSEHIEKAIDAAENAFEKWQFYPERPELFFRAAELARENKLELSVLLSKENGKAINEAVADINEGIDFMEYYARSMNEMNEKVISLPKEKNTLFHIPLGIGSIIAPWNFPFAILIGMTSAAIVTGNTVLMKPSTNTPLIAHAAFELLEKAGIPKGVVNYLPCRGTESGDRLVQDSRVRFISFTGSTKVGQSINSKASNFAPKQIWFKRTILETGGKNHVIVCDDAELDNAVSGVANSAFGFSGQKCSACAVVLVQEKISDSFVTRLIEYTQKLVIGDPCDPRTFTGPVISEDAMKKIMKYVDIGKSEGKLLVGGKRISEDKGHYITPTIFSDLPDSSRLLSEEIFGPVLVVKKFKTLEDAFLIAKKTGYGLTGGIFTTSDKNKILAQTKFHVGNLYINKKSGACTGAMVGRQPFGGFNLSGTDSKTGGPNYLHLFMQEKSVSDSS